MMGTKLGKPSTIPISTASPMTTSETTRIAEVVATGAIATVTTSETARVVANLDLEFDRALLALAERGSVHQDGSYTSILRKSYTGVFDCPTHGQDPTFWKPLFLKRALKLTSYIATSSMGGREEAKDPLLMSLDRKTVLEVPAEEQALLIGGKEGCDVYLDEIGISRICAILVLSPSTSEIALVDVGGLSGYEVWKDGKCISESGPDNRKTTYLEWDTHYVLVFGEHRLELQPVLCILCCEKSRSVRFGCRHLVCCSDCAEQVDKCPICRKDKTSLPIKPQEQQSTCTMQEQSE